MGRKETFYVHPSGYEFSKEEWFRLSILDIVIPPNYNTYALIFKLDNPDETTIIEIFKRGIETTLAQCRHMAGTVEKNEHGDYSIVKKRDSTVKFVVQWLNGLEDEFPSYSDLERANFTCERLGNHALLAIEGMPKACHPDNSPVMVGFQLNFIPEGLIFTVHIHHFAIDMAGTTSFVGQIADNCYSIMKGTPAPSWDDALLDRSRFVAPDVPEEDQIDPVPPPKRHPGWLPCSWLLFHLPPSKSAELKQLATSENGTWISTYDALCALLWRIILRHRAHIYKPDLASPAIFGEAMNMRSRLTPKLSARYQGNVLSGGLSQFQENPLTLAEVISEAPLPQIAAFIRTITTSVTQETLEDRLAKVAPIRDKSNLDVPLDSLPPMSLTTTDWRDAKLCDYDFGIGRPMAYRNLSDTVVENMVIIYPPHRGNPDIDQGLEVVLPFEKHAIHMLMEDPDIKEFFEFRGFEAGAL